MANWYYTDLWRQQHGPVASDEMLRLNGDGVIGGETSVWREGMTEWEPFRLRAIEFFESDAEGKLPELGVCAHSGKVMPCEEMLPYGEALIAVDAKRDFVQSLMETGKTMVVDATEPATKYVGFWWRVLGYILDELVKMVPNWIFAMIPPVVMAVFMGRIAEDSDLGGIIIGAAYFVYMFLTLAFMIFYETWMVGRFQATVGKLVIGAKVVNPDETRVTYGRAFIRWAAKNVLSPLIAGIPPLIVYGFLMYLAFSGLGDTSRSALLFATMMFGIVVAILLAGLFSGVYWMAAFDSEKRALHDRVSATRVVKKNQ